VGKGGPDSGGLSGRIGARGLLTEEPRSKVARVGEEGGKKT
jgi:hypothetical protein